MKFKKCSKCNKVKATKYFYKDCTNKDGFNCYCIECRKIWRLQNIDKIKKHYIKNKLKYKSQQRVWYLKNKFNLTLDDYNKILLKQKGVCAICGLKERRKIGNTINNLSVDHNHKTGKIRELLCDRCNLVLNRCNEDIGLLKKLIGYIIKHN
jgi:hypothetical protein